MSWRRWLLLGLVGIALLALLVRGLWPAPQPVSVVEAQRGPLTQALTAEGRTRVIDRYHISAPFAGLLGRPSVKVGDPVQAGQPLLQLAPLPSQALDPRSEAQAQAAVQRAQAAVRAAEANAKAAEADAELAQLEYERVQKLYRKNTVAKDALDRAESRVRQAQALLRSARFAVEVSKGELRAAEAALEYERGEATHSPLLIEAPVEGVILKRYRESAGVVSAGEMLLEIGNPRSLEVEVDVLSADAVRLQPGMRVWLERWGGDKPLEARVKRVEPVGFTKISALGVEEQRVWVIVELVSPYTRWQALGDGYRVEARFELWHAAQVLQVPASALFRQKEAWAVFVVNDERAMVRPVTLGRRGDFQVQVVEGLEVGERVVRRPHEALQDGSRVVLSSD